MAKKKKETEDDSVEVVDKKAKPVVDLDSLYIGASALIDRPQAIIPVSPAMDLMLRGGVPEGSVVIPTGPPKVGKTSFCIHFAANAQKPEYGGDFCPEGRDVYIYNIEGRLKKRDLLGINGFNIDKCFIIESEPGKIKSAEEYIDIGEKLINEKVGAVHIFDSFSSLCSAEEREADIADKNRPVAPTLLSKMMKRVCNVVPVNRSIVMGITHLMANSGPNAGQKKWIEGGGQKVQYAVDVKLHAKYSEAIMVGEQQVGQYVHWQCTSSALGPPGKCTSVLRYGYGLDKEQELVTILKDLRIIKKSGKWYKFPNEENCDGVECARNYLLDHPEYFTELNQQFREMLQL